MVFHHRRSGLRNCLVTALVSCADTPLKAKARRFLRGLSSDELQFIAEFLGSCILEAPEPCASGLARQIASFQLARSRSSKTQIRVADHEHKMILVLEYLRRSGTPVAAPTTAQSRYAMN